MNIQTGMPLPQNILEFAASQLFLKEAFPRQQLVLARADLHGFAALGGRPVLARGFYRYVQSRFSKRSPGFPLVPFVAALDAGLALFGLLHRLRAVDRVNELAMS